MKPFIIIDENGTEQYRREFESLDDARDWVINHLDLSLNWSVAEENLNFWIGFRECARRHLSPKDVEFANVKIKEINKN